jgi:DNA replication initiation complex subunit (GINS family)
MSEVIITYETLYELLRQEKFKTELQKLSPDFFKNVVNYLNEKESIIKSQSVKDNIFASTEVEKTKTQLKNVKNILKEIYDKREAKILKSAQFNSRTQTLPDTSSMLAEEESLYHQLQNTLSQSRKGILFNVLNKNLPTYEQQKPLKRENKTDSIQIQILQSIPEFVGPDLEVYGPFEVNQSIKLPLMIANNLIQNKQAQKNENS